MAARHGDGNERFKLLYYTAFVIGVGTVAGVVLMLLSGLWPASTTEHALLLSLGSGLLATACVSIILQVVWSRQRVLAEQEELSPLVRNLESMPGKFDEVFRRLENLEGRLEAFKQLGLNKCFSSRGEALARFLAYATETTGEAGSAGDGRTDSGSCDSAPSTVNIVSSSARGLIGYIDRDPSEIQRQWRDLIRDKPGRFRFLLTHPAFAHLRLPAEERASGDIELEILKTAIFLNVVAGMTSSELRLYRGSPTVFAIQAGEHILVNPYPYGQMAMDTLCLEFESAKDDSYVANFMRKHFSQTWSFFDQDSKVVDGKKLVVGIDNLDDIVLAFSECTFLNEPKRLRLTELQVRELDRFYRGLQPKSETRSGPSDTPFLGVVKRNGFDCSDVCDQRVADESSGSVEVAGR